MSNEVKVKKHKKSKGTVDGSPLNPLDPTTRSIDGESPTNDKRKRPIEDAEPSESAEAPKEKKKKRKKGTVPDDGAPVQPVLTSGVLEEPSRKKSKRDNRSPPSSSGPISTTARKITEVEARAYLEKNGISIDAPTEPVTPITAFDQLPISSTLRGALKGFEQPTPIQACAWPALLRGHDVVGIAETGSGKTLAFGLPALAYLTSEKGKNASKAFKGKGGNITVLVVAPTRELAIQTHETLESIGAPFGIKSVCVYGGVDKGPQKKLLATPSLRIVVGTPGRLLDLANEGACDLSGVSYLVLDEADRMLDKGFENDIRNIISQTADMSQRQTLMFSATWPESVRRLASTFQKTPVRITVGRDELTANSRVVQSVDVFDDPRSKDKRLHQLLKSLNHLIDQKLGEESRILVFVLYKKEADRVLDTLKYIGYTAGAIHGDLGQAQRMKALEEFKTGKTGLLVATDVAARGLDIPNVAAVINYSFPLTIEDYIHRIGRTGRGGKNGKSFTFFTGEKHERALAGELARVLRDGGFDSSPLQKFPMTLKKKEHSAYGAFFRDDIAIPDKPTKIKFN